MQKQPIYATNEMGEHIELISTFRKITKKSKMHEEYSFHVKKS